MNYMESKKKGITLYDFLITILIITSLAFYDIKPIFLGVQAITVFYTVFILSTNGYKIKNHIFYYACWLVLFSTYSFLSLLWSAKENETALSCTLSVVQVGLIAICILIYAKDDKRLYGTVLNAFLLAGLVLCFRFFVSVPFKQWGKEERFSKDTIFGSNEPALVLAYASSFLMWRLFVLRKDKIKFNFKTVLYFFGIILFMFVSMMIGTKKGVFIFLINMLIFILCQAKNIISTVIRLLIAVMIAYVLYMIIMKVPILYKSIGYRFEGMIAGFLGEENVDGSTIARMNFAEDAIRVFKTSPLIGIGQDGYRYANSFYRTYSHNNYTEILANLGIIGAIIFYSLHLLIFRGIAKKREKILPLSIILTILILDIAMVSYSSEMVSVLLAMSFAMVHCAQEKNYIEKETR